MAEPLDPNTPGAPGAPSSPGGDNGENNRLNRDFTPLGRGQNSNLMKGLGLAAVIGLFLLMMMIFRKEEPPPPPPQTEEPAVETVDAIRRPPVEMDRPSPPPPPPPPPPQFDEMAAERERLLLLKIRGLQKQMLERRRSPMLVVSDPPRSSAASAPAGLATDGTTPAAQNIPSPFGIDPYDANPNTPRMGDVGPVLQQEAVPARLLRTTAYTITEGTVIPAILETAINSQLPGLVRALNSADVYSHDGSQLLIPKGSRLVGRYQSSIRRNQVRVFIIWTRILRADGLSVLINSPGTDPLGRAGVEGDVDTHFFQIFGAAILMSVLDAGLDIGIEAIKERGSNNTNIGQGESGLSRAGEIALQDSIRIQPTIHIDQGTRISVMVARDLDFEAVEMARAAAQRK